MVKYFYDEKGNNTAVVEENQNDKDHTICITYTYDSDGNVIYNGISRQWDEVA